MPLYRSDSVVLRTYKLGEADRIVVFYTRNRGKVRAVAKGVRRTKSRFGARLEPGSIVHVQFYEGRNLDIVTQAETVQRLGLLRSDLGRYGRAALILETIDHLTEEGEANPALYRLLTGVLAELDREGNPLVLPAFVAKLLVLEGVQPLLEQCANCGSEGPLVALALHLGGVVCRECRQGEPISDDARAAMQLVLDGRVRHVLDTTPAPVAAELEAISSKMLEQHLERRLRSASVLYHHLQDTQLQADQPDPVKLPEQVAPATVESPTS